MVGNREFGGGEGIDAERTELLERFAADDLLIGKDVWTWVWKGNGAANR
jgi:hypothetical protein